MAFRFIIPDDGNEDPWEQYDNNAKKANPVFVATAFIIFKSSLKYHYFTFHPCTRFIFAEKKHDSYHHCTNTYPIRRCSEKKNKIKILYDGRACTRRIVSWMFLVYSCPEDIAVRQRLLYSVSENAKFCRKILTIRAKKKKNKSITKSIV